MNIGLLDVDERLPEERIYMSERKNNNIRCSECKYAIATSSSERVWLCDNPNLKTYCKNVKHGSKFSCGYGRWWNDENIEFLERETKK
jgi:hypothetical protein